MASPDPPATSMGRLRVCTCTPSTSFNSAPATRLCPAPSSPHNSSLQGRGEGVGGCWVGSCCPSGRVSWVFGAAEEEPADTQPIELQEGSCVFCNHELSSSVCSLRVCLSQGAARHSPDCVPSGNPALAATQVMKGSHAHSRTIPR